MFSYLYLWTVSPQVWPGASGQTIPPVADALVCAILLAGSGAAVMVAARALAAGRHQRLIVPLVVAGAAALLGSLAWDIIAQWRSGLRPDMSSYGAIVYANAFLQAQLVVPVVLMAAFVLARYGAGKLDKVRRVTFDNLMLLWLYAVAQGLFALLLIHGFPRLV